LRVLLLVTSTFVLAACSSGPRYVRDDGALAVRGPETHYRVGALPTQWHAVQVAGENDVAFAHDGLDAVVQANARCDDADMDVPLESLTQHLLIGFTERQISEERTVPMDDREARITHVVAKLDGVPREMELVVIKKDGCVYDLALIAPHDHRFGTARSDFQAFVRSFHADPRPGEQRR
jgi:hypothetical protein